MIRIASAGLALVAGLVVSISSAASAQVPAPDGPVARTAVVFYATPTDLTAQYGGPNRPILWGEDGTGDE